MESIFSTYLGLGFDHILDSNGIDHVIFVLALCAAYDLKGWKRLLILITAFTLGHSLTLALSALDWVNVDSDLVELVIAITIGLTALNNVALKKVDQTAHRIKYFIALVFGLVHGLGFSGYFKTLLGREEEVLFPLFSFNLGIELGQIIIVAGMLLFFLLAEKLLKVKPREYNLFISGLAFGASLLMFLERI